MREIKFRAWFIGNEDTEPYMDYNPRIGRLFSYKNIPPTSSLIEVFGDTYLNEVVFKDHEWQYMQYTGLKDKNGKEVYEGDIIQWSYGSDCVFEATIVYGDILIKGDLDSDKRIVGFYRLFDDGSKIDFPHSDDNYEVIGNIFEK